MSWHAYLAIVFTFAAITAMADDLSPQERAEIDARIERFYAHPEDASLMTARVPKYDAATGAPSSPNRPFAGAAKRAAHPERAGIESGDAVEDLASTWSDEVVKDLDALPVQGDTALDLWSDDYWKTKYGQTSYRYASPKYYKTYQEAVGAYAQPTEFTKLLDTLTPDKLAETVKTWSPAEKYDLAVGDTAFSLTNQQKEVGQSQIGDDGNVEAWMGICHGWAAAAIMLPKASAPVKTVGANGVSITWFPHDVRALASLSWANADFRSNFIGGRCESKKAETFPNGRIKAQECFDTNPATFHYAITNMIGLAKASFVMDAAFDYEVWNQPVQGYTITYFNPLDPKKRSPKWSEVAVDYDAAFKAKDRFQKPLTRGVFVSGEKWDDGKVKKMVGAIVTLKYMTEIFPTATEKPEQDHVTRVTYTYDLELEQNGAGKWVAQGGEWHSNGHPDFLWVPEKGESAVASHEDADVEYSIAKAPGADLTHEAASASGDGIPLCKVMRSLLGKANVSCR